MGKSNKPRCVLLNLSHHYRTPPENRTPTSSPSPTSNIVFWQETGIDRICTGRSYILEPICRSYEENIRKLIVRRDGGRYLLHVYVSSISSGAIYWAVPTQVVARKATDQKSSIIDSCNVD